MTAIRIIIASALVTTGVIKGAPTLAQPAAADVNVSVVATADLDLSSSAGQRQLDLRLVQAAREVCGIASDSDLEGKNDVRACRDDVLERAHSQRDELIAAKQGSGTITVVAAR